MWPCIGPEGQLAMGHNPTLSLRVCLPPRSLPPLRVNPQGSRGFYIRAERASLPSHASDMLSARLQAIGGTRTFTSQDSQLCRLLTPLPSFSERDLANYQFMAQLLGLAVAVRSGCNNVTLR